MRRKLKLGLDFDGVVVDSYSLRAVVAREMFGRDISSILLQETRFVEAGLDRAQYDAVKKAVYQGAHEPNLVKDAVLYIQLIQKQEERVSVVTARTGEFLSRAAALLEKNGLSLPIQGVGYKTSKETACAGLDLFVDDDSEKLIPLIGKVPHLLFFGWPHNSHEQVPPEITRVESWYDIYQYVRYEVDRQ